MRRLVVLVLIVMLWLPVVVLAPAASGAQDTEPTPAPVVVDEVDSPLGEIIPKPNSGAPPQNPGDRGGSHQLLLFGLIITFMVVAFFSVRRSMKKALAAAAADRVCS